MRLGGCHSTLKIKNEMSLFKKLFGSKENKETAKQTEKDDREIKNPLDKPIDEIKKEREGYVSLGRSIFPVIKNVNDPRIKMALNSEGNEIITTPLAEGIVKCYVLDVGDKFEMISQSHLKQFGLDKEIVDNTAIRNLVDKFNQKNGISVQDFSEQNPQSKPFFKLEMDANYPPSMMLVEDFWDNTAKEIVKSNRIAVSIPAKNLLFFSDYRLMESFRTMRPVANQMFEASIQDNIHLTKNTYIRKDGKWIKFEDTPEQMEELW